MPLDAHGHGDGEDNTNQAAGQVTFEELWEHRAALRDICQRIVGDAATADDVVQETYMRALDNLDRLERRPSLMPWLATVARRRSIDELRKRKYSQPVDETPEDPSFPELDPGEAAAVNDTVRQVRDALTSLTDRERDLLMRQVNQGISLAQLAEDEDTSIASVRSVLNRARTKLRNALAETGSYVIAPITASTAWMKRKLGPVNARLHQAYPAVPGGYERMGEAVTAGVAAAALTLGGLIPATDGPPNDGPARVAASETQSAQVEFGAVSMTSDSPSETEAAVASRGTRSARAGDGQPVAAAPTSEESGPAGRGVTPAGSDTPVPQSPSTDPDHVVPPEVPDPGEQNPPPDDPDDGDFDHIAASSSGDHLFAGGEYSSDHCPAGDCPLLFRSSDGGRSWQRVEGEGYQGGTLMVAPDYPQDPRLLTMDTDGLKLSWDGGEHFERVLGPSYTGPAAMSPAFSDGDDRVFIGSSPTWEYDVESDDSPEAFPVTGLTGPLSRFAFSPSFPAENLVFAGTTALGPSGTDTPSVARCEDGVCDQFASLEHLEGVPFVHVTSDFETSPTLYAWGRSGGLYRSVDGGQAFSLMTGLPVAGSIQAVADDGATTYVALVPDGGWSASGSILAYDEAQGTWRTLGADSALRWGAASVSVVGDVLLAAPAVAGGGGLLCSGDGGASWHDRCGA